MATDVTIGGDGTLFIDTDHVLTLEVVDNASPAAPVDVAGWAGVFDVRVLDNSTTALLSKDWSIIGTFNATRTLNTQRLQVELSKADMASTRFKGSNLTKNPHRYRHSWKRTDTGVTAVVARGDFLPEKATAP